MTNPSQQVEDGDFWHPVILVHGLDDTSTKMRSIATRLQQLGRRVYSIDLQPNNGTSLLPVLAQQLAEFIDYHAPQYCDLVGFSMGGLVARYYLQRCGGLERVERYVAISAPQQGTIAAYFTQRAGCVQMRLHSPLIEDLQKDIHRLEGIQVTSIWTPFDLMILPATSSQLPVGQTIQIPVIAHAWMVEDQRVIAAVVRGLGHQEKDG